MHGLRAMGLVKAQILLKLDWTQIITRNPFPWDSDVTQTNST